LPLAAADADTLRFAQLGRPSSLQVSEVLSLSLSMQGIFRPPHLCKQRFRQITVCFCG
jgi:hypothetical protein